MEEIKVGEYIRTNDGSIYQLEDLEDPIFLSDKFYNKIVKHSPNIIDLIEEGDYVNGYKVIKANLEDNDHEKFVDIYCPSMNLKLEFLEHIYAERIKSIVTKQQFNQMKYIVGGGINGRK